MSIRGCGGGGRIEGQSGVGDPQGSENVWFLGCCDASDVIDAEECIISIMRGSGGHLNSLRPGVGVHVEDRKGVITGCEKWLGGK